MNMALATFRKAAAEPDDAVAAAIAAGRKPIRVLGVDAPRELLLAAGFQPIRLVAAATGSSVTDAFLTPGARESRTGRLLAAVLASVHQDVPVLITAADAAQTALFAVLREIARRAERPLPPFHLLDLVHIGGEPARAYNTVRLRRCIAWLRELGGEEPTPARLGAEAAELDRQRGLIGKLLDLRTGTAPRLSGCDVQAIVASGAILPLAEHCALLEQALAETPQAAPLSGRRVFVTGTAHEHASHYEAIEAAGAVIVGEEQDWGPWLMLEAPRAATIEALADPALRTTASFAIPEERMRKAAAAAARAGAEATLHLTIGDDEAAPWDGAAVHRHMGPALQTLPSPAQADARFSEAVHTWLSGPQAGTQSGTQAGTAALAPSATPAKSGSAAKPPQRSRKSLSAVADFNRYQRDWFADVRARVQAGAPFAMVNANAPQEILRTLDIPFVVNQWWASIVAAKQQSSRYMALLRAHHHPTSAETYSAQGVAAAFDEDAEAAPWGGLPRPTSVHAIASSDATTKIFSEWAEATGADLLVYARTSDARHDLPLRWWDVLHDEWDSALEPERLDLLETELRAVVAHLEDVTGRRFDHDRFVEVMDLVNEQEDYYRRTRELVARTVPAPIGIADSMPATMVPQWHRGTEWARDAAKAFYEEVAARVAAGAGAVSDERVRLMWVGRGLWSDMAFYQRWEESHGAVFVWSMYLGLAADGYIRRFDGGRDPMRALAARFLTMGDELRMPSWAAPWHVHEGLTHQVDGAVALADADPFVLRALAEAGIPVLELGVDNFNRDGEDSDATAQRITAFVEGAAGAKARARLGA